MSSRKRVYSKAFLELGFTFIVDKGIQKPQCVVCNAILCKESMKDDRLKLIPLSNNTIRRRIDELSNDIKDQLISRVKNSGIFAIQLDETTDVASAAQLMVYIRYKGEMDIEEDLLMCSPLEATTKGVDVFLKVDAFFKETRCATRMENCVGVTTDGSPSMLGVHSGFLAHVKKENPSVLATHCIIHRHALAVKNLQPDLEEVMSDVTV
ncbi:SCAN domain-containing protein 3-like [Homarus americanus]|uniref:SCAN domain-containing protein 3-like n=1 Tax=Homarus americanus TaxID=6706 RepID=UPI001C4791AF|nr:SCAN domain-containing protein 3-like [Homarus americanus]